MQFIQGVKKLCLILIFFTSAGSFVVLNGLKVVMKAQMKDHCWRKDLMILLMSQATHFGLVQNKIETILAGVVVWLRFLV